MKKSPLIAAASFTALLFLAACGTPSEPVNLREGGQGYRITCGGPISTTASCYEKAGYICGNRGYTVIHENSIMPPSDANYFWNAAAFETTIKCNQ